SFWELVKSKLLYMLKLCSDSGSLASSSSSESQSENTQYSCLHYPPPFLKNIKLPHVWWILTSFSRLYTYDCLGKEVLPKSVGIKGETKLLRTLIRLSVGEQRINQAVTEVELRFYMRCCLKLHHLWGGERNSEWVSLLWDYFSKHLDSSFLLPAAGLDGLACLRYEIFYD
ncbi:hypothetical protein SK128_027970, partial [Halocaridina rubra]